MGSLCISAILFLAFFLNGESTLKEFAPREQMFSLVLHRVPSVKNRQDSLDSSNAKNDLSFMQLGYTFLIQAELMCPRSPCGSVG